MAELQGEEKVKPVIQEGIIVASTGVSQASMSFVDNLPNATVTDKDKEAAQKAAFLGEGPLGSTIWRLTWPDFVGKIVQALYVMVDAIYIGNMAGNNQQEKSLSLAACTLAMPVDQLFHISIGLLIGIGTSALYGQNLGKGDIKRAKQIIGNMYFLCLFFGIVYPFIGYFLLDYLLILAGASDKDGTLGLGRIYLTPMIFCSILTFLAISHNNSIRGEGNSRYSALGMFCGAITNIILDPFLIRITGNSILGAGIATMVGNGVTSFMGLYYFFSNKAAVRVEWKDFMPKWDIIKDIMSVGISGIISSASGSVVSIIMNNLLLKYSAKNFNSLQVTEILAVVGACGKFSFFCFMPMLSLSHGCLPIYSFCYGAKKHNRFMSAMKIQFFCEVILGLILVIAGSFAGNFLSVMFSESLFFKGVFSEALRYTTCGLVLNSVTSAVFPALQGCGKGLPSAIILFLKQLVFLLAFAQLFCAILKDWWGNMYAYPLAEVVGCIMSVAAFFIYKNTFTGKKN